MKLIQTTYFLVWIIAVLFAGFLLEEVIPPCTEIFSPDFIYMMTYLCQIMSILLIYLAVKMFHFRLVKSWMKKHSETLLLKYKKCNLLRQAVLMMMIILNLRGYYLTTNESFIYVVGIILIAYLFCFPTKGELDEFKA